MFAAALINRIARTGFRLPVPGLFDPRNGGRRVRLARLRTGRMGFAVRPPRRAAVTVCLMAATAAMVAACLAGSFDGGVSCLGGGAHRRLGPWNALADQLLDLGDSPAIA